MGTRAISGSEAMRFKKRTMAASASSIPSSMLISIICAPSSTCFRATSRAASYWSSRMRLLNRADPVTLQRSPTLTKFLPVKEKLSRPLR